ncbi:MAG: hypothetical protein OGMRLDGQ_003263 [Candidatus Fervidibacter sp.]
MNATRNLSRARGESSRRWEKLPEFNPWQMALQQFHQAADVIGLDDTMRDVLSHCQRELIVNFR